MALLGDSDFIRPCIPRRRCLAHEIKYDGYRTQIHLAKGHAVAFTRNGHDWSMKYALVLVSARALINREAILDGEMVVQDETGRTDFKKLASAIRWERAASSFIRSIYLALTGRTCTESTCSEVWADWFFVAVAFGTASAMLWQLGY